MLSNARMCGRFSFYPAPMRDEPLWALGIETSNPSAAPDGADAGGEVALARLDHEPLSTVASEPVRGGAGRSDDLASAIDRLCRRAGVAPTDLGLVAVSAGPGGFTAVRIAVATAKLIAEATGARCVPVPTAAIVADAMRAGSPEGGALRGRFLVALASKRDSAWCQVFAPDGAAASIGEVLSAQALALLHAAAPLDAIVADRHLAASIRDWANSADIPIVPPVFSAAACLRLATAIPGVDPAALAPIYPREPEAVTLWRARAHTKA